MVLIIMVRFSNIMFLHIYKIMNKFISPIVFFLLLPLILSCNKENRIVKEVKELQGKPISFIDGYQYDNPDLSVSVDSCLQSKIKMVSYWEDFSCTQCAYKILVKWEKEFHEKIGSNVNYIFIINSMEKNLISELRHMGFSLPILLYPDNSYGQKNQLNVLARNKTFLLDENNKIVVVGEPFGNDALWNVYKEAIKILNNNLINHSE